MSGDATPAPRDRALDTVRGMLVVGMVVYHAMNYFSTVGNAGYGALRFVNGAFVFLAGFVCAMGHGPGGADRPYPHRAAHRLWQRGAKLVLLFTALNLLIGAAGLTSYKNVSFDVDGFMGDLGAIYGSGDSPRVAFRILVAIAYTLMLAPLYIVFERARLALVASTAATAALYTVVLPIAPLPYFVLVGLCGVCAGLCCGDVALAAVRRRSTRAAGVSLVVGLFAPLAMNVLSGNALTYSAGIALVLTLLYGLAVRLDPQHSAARWTELLGRYALLGYVAQIGLLYILHKVLGGTRWPFGAELLLICAATCGLLVLLCGALSRLRSNWRWIDRGYRAVFA